MSINATGIIFSNMHDEELHEITTSRTMGSLPFGGRYRLVDFTLSNMHNSGINSVGVIAKRNYQSLIEHLGSGKEWDLSRKREGLFIFPPFGRNNSGYYKNKIEALYGIMAYIRKSKNDYVIITDCDVICNMNWRIPLQHHINSKADLTIIVYQQNVSQEQATNQSIYTLNTDGYVSDILINQTTAKNQYIGTNMWIIGKSLLEHLIEDAIAHNLEDFERDIMQKNLNQYKIAAWEFKGFIRKINSIRDFFHANIDILNPSIRNELFHQYGPIYTKVQDDVPTRYGSEANVSNSLIADGCIIQGSVENSILFSGVKINKGSKISHSIIMQDCIVGENVTLNYVLSDKNVIFNNHRMLMGYDNHPIYITKGSVV